MAKPSSEDFYLEDRGSLTLQVHWSPPLAVLYDLSAEDRRELDEELKRLVREALVEDPLVKKALKEDADVDVEQGLIGPTAQATTTVDVKLRNVPQELLTEISDAVDNHRRNLTARATSGLMSLLSIMREASGTSVSPIISFEWESESPVRPTLQQEIAEELLYLSIDIPHDLTPMSREWNEVIEIAPQVGEWFIEGFTEHLGEEGVDPPTLRGIEARRVQQPPFADPLTPAFFIWLGGVVIGAVAERIVDDGIEAGEKRVRERLRARGLTDEMLLMSCSPGELVRRAKTYVRRSGYDHADLDASYIGFNRRSNSGYIFPIDPEKPMGWDISVRFYEGEWKFRVLNDPRRTELKILSLHGELINTKTVDLFALQESLS